FLIKYFTQFKQGGVPLIPLFIPSHFGEHYQLLAWGQTPFSSGEVVTTTDAARLFSIITRELTIPAEQWRGVLMRLSVSIPPNFFHAADIYHELVKLFQRRQLQLVKIPRLAACCKSSVL